MKRFKQTDERIMYSYIVRIDKNIHIIDKSLIIVNDINNCT